MWCQHSYGYPLRWLVLSYMNQLMKIIGLLIMRSTFQSIKSIRISGHFTCERNSVSRSRELPNHPHAEMGKEESRNKECLRNQKSWGNKWDWTGLALLQDQVEGKQGGAEEAEVVEEAEAGEGEA
jgi:hypothetical protein